MDSLAPVFAKNKEWVRKKLSITSDYFTELAKGQAPKSLYIGCADSRVSPEIFTASELGEMFVTRNIANVVSSTDVSMSCVIKYAVSVLKVDHVIVCGHYGCGGVKAAMDPQSIPTLDPWLQNIRDVYASHRKTLDAITDETARYKKLIELNTLEQCANVMKTHDVQVAYRDRNIQIHGWIFDISTGTIIDLKFDTRTSMNTLLKTHSLLG